MGAKEELEAELAQLKAQEATYEQGRRDYNEAYQDAEWEFARTPEGKRLIQNHRDVESFEQKCRIAVREREQSIAEFFVKGEGTRASYSTTYGKNIETEILDAIKAEGINISKVKGGAIEDAVNRMIWKARDDDATYKNLVEKLRVAGIQSSEASTQFENAEREFIRTKKIYFPDMDIGKIDGRIREVEKTLATMGEPTNSKDERWVEVKKLMDNYPTIYEKLKPKMEAFLKDEG